MAAKKESKGNHVQPMTATEPHELVWDDCWIEY